MRTPLCDLLGIEAPVIQASIGPWRAVELAGAVCEAGGLGSLGTATRAADAVVDDIRRLRELTGRPFAVNHTMRPFDEDCFAAALAERPRVVSLALGEPGDLPARVHDAGALFLQQVHDVAQAERAADAGADVIIAQGGEAGGFSAGISTLVLVPQVVDAVSPVPVVAAGGIADGRGLAAALTLGAAGVNVGTRFVASAEAAVDSGWKSAIVDSGSDRAVKIEFADEVFPPPTPGGYDVRPRALRTAYIDEGHRGADPADMRERLMAALQAGRPEELVPFTGQSAGLVHGVLPTAEIVTRMVAEAEAILSGAAAL